MGRGRWFSIPKDEISLLEIRSKIERQGVLKRGKLKNFPRFFYLILVTHWFADILGLTVNFRWGAKNITQK